MEKTVWKYPLETTGDLRIEMPVGAEILTVQNQMEVPCIWALVNPEAKTEMRYFRIYGAGHPVINKVVKGNYIGNYQLQSGCLIFHVFEYPKIILDIK